MLTRSALLPLLLIAQPALVAVAGEPEGPDLQLVERMRRAEQAYDQALQDFKSDDIEKGQTGLKGAFSVLAETVEDDRLAYELKGDFQRMLEKARSFDGGEPPGEEPSELDVTDQALRETPAPASARRPGPIRIDPDNEITQKYIHLYTEKRKESVENALARSGRYKAMILKALEKAELPEELFYLVMAESEYKLNAVSRSGAGGLWQFMPGTARKYGLEVSYWMDERFDPEKATQAAIRYLTDLYHWFGDWHLAMAAYNRGENGLGRDMQFTRSVDFGNLSDRKALPDETHHYVPKFMACALIGKNPAKYGLKPVYEEPEAYDVVGLERDLDLGVAARAAGVSLELMRGLNPSLRAWCTPKGRPGFALRVPAGSKEKFLEALKDIKDWNPGPSVVRHTVRHGEFLGKIARQYRTSVRSIIEDNKLRSAKLIRPGMILRIRPGRGYH